MALLLLSLLALMGLALAWWWTHPPEPERDIRARHRALATLERSPVPGEAAGLERWSLIASDGDTVSALWRRGAQPEPAWVVVLLGGIGTDDRAALLVPGELPVGVLAVSWPWKGSRKMSREQFVASVPALHRALLDTPGAIARGVEGVRRAHPNARVALIGASLGVPPTVAALSIASVDALILVDGAADLSRLLHAEVSRELERSALARPLSGPAASLGARLLSSLEPSRFGAAARATPVLLVDAEDEERYPPGCVESLHRTFPHAVRVKHPGRHIRPEDRAQVRSVIQSAVTWLATLPRSEPAAR